MNNYIVTNMAGESQTYQSETATIRALFDEQNIPYTGVTVFLNGEPTHDLDTTIADGDIIVVVAKTSNAQ